RVHAPLPVPPGRGRDDADVRAPALGALARAPRYPQLDLAGRAQAPVAQLQPHGHADRVLHAVAAPGGPDARLHGAQRLAVGVPRLEARLDEPRPDLRQLLDASAEHVDALATGDLRVQPELLRELPDDTEPLGRDRR